MVVAIIFTLDPRFLRLQCHPPNVGTKFKWVKVLVVFRYLLDFSPFFAAPLQVGLLHAFCFIWGEGQKDFPNAPHDSNGCFGPTGKSMLDRPHYAANGLAQTFTGNYRHFAGHLLLDRCSCCHRGFHLLLQLKS